MRKVRAIIAFIDDEKSVKIYENARNITQVAYQLEAEVYGKGIEMWLRRVHLNLIRRAAHEGIAKKADLC